MEKKPDTYRALRRYYTMEREERTAAIAKLNRRQAMAIRLERSVWERMTCSRWELTWRFPLSSSMAQLSPTVYCTRRIEVFNPFWGLWMITTCLDEEWNANSFWGRWLGPLLSHLCTNASVNHFWRSPSRHNVLNQRNNSKIMHDFIYILQIQVEWFLNQ